MALELLVLSVFVFFFGAAIGSFVNVVVMRTLRQEEFVSTRSHCDHCSTPLRWYELIPLLSFIALRGRCRTCQKEIDIQHPIVELLTGMLFVWWLLIGFAFFQLTQAPLQVIQPLFWLTMGVVMLAILISDIRALYIPDWTILALSLGSIGYRILLILQGVDQPGDFARSLFGAALAFAFFLFLWLVTRKQGMGFGDVKLVFALGLLLEWPEIFVATFFAFLTGALVGVILLLLRKTRFGVPLPFGPFLILGTIVALLWGDSLLRWYLSYL